MANTTLCLYWIALLWTVCCKGQDSVCPRDNVTDRCCSGYRKINGSCTACIGFTGENCEKICPSSNYGSRCRYTCNCTHYEICSRFVGCIPKPGQKNSCILPMHNDSESRPDLPFRRESCNLLMDLVIALGISQLVTLIFCVTALCLKCCRLPPRRTKSSNNNTGVSELHAEKELNQITSRCRGISLESENTNGDHYHTVRNQDLCGSSTSYDTFETADRIKKHVDQNWSATNQWDVQAFPSDNLHDVRNTTPVNSHATQSSGRPYSLQKL